MTWTPSWRRWPTTRARGCTPAVLDRSFATPPDPAFRDELLAYAARVPVQAALEALRSQRDLDLTPGLAAIDCPVTVVHGLRDPARTPDQARELAAAIPGARLRLLDTGHTPVYEAPDEVATELLALLARRRRTPGVVLIDRGVANQQARHRDRVRRVARQARA